MTALKGDPGPAIVAIVTQKNEVSSAVAKALLKACAMPGKLQKSAEGGVITVAAENAKLDGAFLVKLDSDFAVAVAHSQLKKAFPEAEFAQGLSAARVSFDPCSTTKRRPSLSSVFQTPESCPSRASPATSNTCSGQPCRSTRTSALTCPS